MKPLASASSGAGIRSYALQRMCHPGSLPFVLAAVVLVLPLARSLAASDPIRIFVKESESWSVSGDGAQFEGTGGGSLQGGAKLQTAEIMKTISKRRECRGIVVTINRERADYILMLDRVGGRGVVQKDNKMALFNKEGDMVASTSTRSLGNAVKDACLAVQGR